ncbi:MAG TPA: c-type cytochrome [Ginsengibacter sp.]
MGVSIKPIFSILVIIFALIFFSVFLPACNINPDKEILNDSIAQAPWYGWNKYQIKPEDSLVRLGHDLIENTSYYFGPKGKIASITNGMNCQNCHMQAGIIPWGNNFSAVVMSYPRFSNRSGQIMSLSRRVNDCFERSLNGMAIDTNGREMHAIIAYMHWIGDDIPAGKKPLGSGIMKLPYLSRPADSLKGSIIFRSYCQRCHGKNGEGQLNADASGFIYPPLWGPHSYNTGAGFFRLSSFAGFVKNNMPFEESNYQHPKLTDEQAWDVAAFVNSQPRPLIKNKIDYPDISKKEIDNPVGPYSDTFPEQQHKYGPYQPIEAERKN